MQFGLMFFAANEDTAGANKYRLLIESAIFGDRHDFSSIWVPERHFTKLGSLYPNAAVLHAALARETRRIGLRAGSVVLPLHNPLRVAEEWAVVDNLSGGRVGISCAPGWNPDDFVFFPERYAERHAIMRQSIETIQKLWQGETLAATSGNGKPVEVRVYPTPLQPTLPLWMTAAGNPQTFIAAGQLGLNLLTHLLDQSVETLAGNIRLYRQARAEHGHDPLVGQVSVMIHTLIGADAAQVHEQARAPYCQYLKSNIGLLKGLAQSRGQEFDPAQMAEADIDSFVNLLYERFATSRGLIGTPETCQDLLGQLARIGVDEVACLLDFGPAVEEILQSLPYLNQLKERFEQAQPASAAATSGASAAPTLEAIRASCSETLAAADFYAMLRGRGVQMAAAFQGIERIWRRDGEALAAVRLPESLATTAHLYETHPAFLDACLQVFIAALPAEMMATGDDTLYLPVGFRSLTAHVPLGDHAWSHALLHTPLDTGNGVFEGDLRILNEAGELGIEVKGFRLQKIALAPLADAADTRPSWLYDIRWHARPLAQDPPPPPEPGFWLIFADQTGVGAALAAQLEQQGASCRIIAPGPTIHGDLAQLLGQTRSEQQRPWRGIVHCWSLDAAAASATTTASLAADQELGVISALSLMQALSQLAVADLPQRTWFVTQGAQVVTEQDESPQIAQAPLWGFGRCLPLETPRIWTGLIDLAPATPPAESARQLAEVLAAPDHEDQQAFRGGQRYVPRLEPDHATALPPNPAIIRPDATYLITGGLGNLGLKIAERLAAQGARQMLLLGRHAPSASAQARLDRLAHQGLGLSVILGDVADQSVMERIAEHIAAGLPPLRGVFHAAGVTSYAALDDLDRESMLAVLRPKVSGTWLLHQFTCDQELDFFVSISSLSPVWGTKGLGHYAAANHFLDVFSHYGRRRGLTTATINLGPLDGGGMASATAQAATAMTQIGLRLLQPTRAVEMLERLLAAGTTQKIVVDVDWATFKPIHQMHGDRPLLETIAVATPLALDEVPTPLYQELLAAPAEQRQAILSTQIQAEVARVLKLDALHLPSLLQGFFDLGMDSLMALELKSRLQQSLGYPLAATLVFEYPTIEALSSYVLALLFGAAVPPETARPAAPPPNTIQREVQALNDAELEALIDAELEALLDG